MRIKGISALAIFCFVAAHMFALTVELVNENQTSPSYVLAAASDAPISYPILPREAADPTSEVLRPAAFPADRQPARFPSDGLYRVDTNPPLSN